MNFNEARHLASQAWRESLKGNEEKAMPTKKSTTKTTRGTKTTAKRNAGKTAKATTEPVNARRVGSKTLAVVIAGRGDDFANEVWEHVGSIRAKRQQSTRAAQVEPREATH